MQRVLFIPFKNQTSQNPYSASSRFRCDWVSKYMRESEVATRQQERSTNYDIYVFQKRFALNQDIELAEKLRGLGKKIIFDLCDAEWAHPERQSNLRYMIELADALTASTRFVADWMSKQIDKEVTVIPDRLDLEKHDLITTPDNDPLVLGWFGNRLTIEYLKGIENILMDASRVNNFTLKVIWENEEKYSLSGIEVENVTWDLKTVNQEIGKCDIILNPHGTDDIGKGKSNNKTITAWALGRPVLEELFAEELPIYLKSDNLRAAAGMIGRKEVVEKYDVHLSVNQLREVINTL